MQENLNFTNIMLSPNYFHYDLSKIYFNLKPGKFEYPELNGWMLVKEAEEKCINDFACAGFTFKGSYQTLNRKMEIYFFHIVANNNNKYFYWSTFKVKRHFVKLVNVTLNRDAKHSQKINVG